jgi:hypothetical protein
MKKPKVILLRGEISTGKTSVMNLVLKKLGQSQCEPSYYRQPFDDAPLDFATVVPFWGRNIALISHSDSAPAVTTDLELILQLNVPLIVGTARSRDGGGSVYKKVYEAYHHKGAIELLMPAKWTKDCSQDKAQQDPSNDKVSDEIISEIKKILQE